MQPAFATRHVSSRGRTTAVVALQDQCASIRLLLHSIAPSKPRHVPPRSPPPCDVHVSAQQVADSCCCIQVIAASSAMGEETRSRTRAGKHATLGWFSPPHFSRDVARCGHPLRLRCRRSVSLSRVVSSVAAPCRKIWGNRPFFRLVEKWETGVENVLFRCLPHLPLSTVSVI